MIDDETAQRRFGTGVTQAVLDRTIKNSLPFHGSKAGLAEHLMRQVDGFLACDDLAGARRTIETVKYLLHEFRGDA